MSDSEIPKLGRIHGAGFDTEAFTRALQQAARTINRFGSKLADAKEAQKAWQRIQTGSDNYGICEESGNETNSEKTKRIAKINRMDRMETVNVPITAKRNRLKLRRKKPENELATTVYRTNLQFNALPNPLTAIVHIHVTQEVKVLGEVTNTTVLGIETVHLDSEELSRYVSCSTGPIRGMPIELFAPVVQRAGFYPNESQILFALADLIANRMAPSLMEEKTRGNTSYVLEQLKLIANGFKNG